MAKTPTHFSPSYYDRLGWGFFTTCFVLFVLWIYYTQRPPAGTNQTMVWSILGALVLYIVAGIYTFTSHRTSTPETPIFRGTPLPMLPVSPLATSYGF